MKKIALLLILTSAAQSAFGMWGFWKQNSKENEERADWSRIPRSCIYREIARLYEDLDNSPINNIPEANDLPSHVNHKDEARELIHQIQWSMVDSQLDELERSREYAEDCICNHYRDVIKANLAKIQRKNAEEYKNRRADFSRDAAYLAAKANKQ